MNVLQLVSSTGFYGAERMILELSEELSRQRVPVKVANLFTPGRSSREITDRAAVLGIPASEIQCDGRFDLSALRRLRDKIVDERIDIVHSHGYKGNFYAFLAAGGRAGLVATCHNWLGDSLKMGSYRWLDKMLLKRFDHIAVVSELLRKETECCGISSNKVTQIPNGITAAVPARKRCEILTAAAGVKEGDIVVGTVGRLSPEKGHRYLLSAIKKLPPHKDNVKVLIVGDGPSREELEREAAGLSMADRVIFTGGRSDVHELLSVMHLFVLPSLREGMPMALLEAMAAGVPVIASAVGEIPGMLDQGKNGLLVTPGDVEGLAAAIAAALNDGAKAAAAARRAAEKVRKEYSAPAMSAKYAEVYRRIEENRTDHR